MRRLFFVVALVAFIQAKDFRPEFVAAMAKFAKQDNIFPMKESPRVAKARFQSFAKFASLVDTVNADYTIPFTAENNFLSILTVEERKAYQGLNISGHENVAAQTKERLVLRSNHPPTRDFSNKISGIKDQGSCGSCWTFAATAALEGEMYFKNSQQGISLSEQEYMECSTTRDGCNGGWMGDCYDYTRDRDRIAPTSAAPYSGRDSRRCSYASTANAMITTGLRLTSNYNFRGDDQLLHMAASHIVSVAIKVSNKFQVYKSGVMVDSTCNVRPDHAVAVVGYGAEGSQKYWKVRNSWGTGWGDGGYIKMDRNKENMCMISTYSHIPVLECRDPNNCTPADPNDGDESNDDSDGDDSDDSDNDDNDDDDGNDDDDTDDGERTPKLCWKKVGLGKCLSSEDAASSICDEEGRENCAVIRLRRCWYGASASKNVKARAFMWLNLPVGRTMKVKEVTDAEVATLTTDHVIPTPDWCFVGIVTVASMSTCVMTRWSKTMCIDTEPESCDF